MNYVKAALLAPVTLSHARPGSLVQTSSAGETWWFISLDDAAAAVAVSGDYSGRGFEAKSASNWRGLEHLGVSIEVDLASGLSNFDVHAKTLYLDRSGTTLQLVYKHDNGNGLQEWKGALIAEGLPESSPGHTHYFSRWRAVIGEGKDRIVLLEVDRSDPT